MAQTDWETLARNSLLSKGVAPSFLRLHRSDIVAWGVIIVVAVGFCGQFLKKDGPDASTILIGIPATVAFALSFWQWRAGTHQGSYERYFDRLKDTNALFSAYQVERLRTGMDASPIPGRETVAGHLQTMFNFAELDTLEYMLGKWSLGYVSQSLTERAVRTFIERCAENRDGFREGMLYWVGAAEGQQRAGYERPTRELVRHIISVVADKQRSLGVLKP